MSSEYKDYAWGQRRPFGLSAMIGIGIGSVVLLFAYWAVDWILHRNAMVAEARREEAAWSVPGPPCPTLSRARYVAQGALAKKSFDYNGVRFGRRFGHAECTSLGMSLTTLKGSRAVCRFSGPALVEVETRKGVYVFAPGVGQPTTVSVVIPDGAPTCVMAGQFQG